jgi:hypothetical protein
MRRYVVIPTIVGLLMVGYGRLANLPVKMDGPDPNEIWFNSGLGVLGLAAVIAATLIVRWLRAKRRP